LQDPLVRSTGERILKGTSPVTITTSSFDLGKSDRSPSRPVRSAIAACIVGLLAVAGGVAVAVVNDSDSDSDSPSAVRDRQRTPSEHTQYLVDTYQIPAATLSSADGDAFTQHLVDTYQIPAATLRV
jgi:hypothetical protein